MAEAARYLAAELLIPNAEQVDASPLVPGSHFDALAAAGLYGAARDPSELGAVIEVLAGACGNTAFVWMQHHNLVRALLEVGGPLRDEWLDALTAGTRRAGIAYAYLRWPGSPAVQVRPSGRDDGWIVNGEAPWVSGWGLVDVVYVAGRHGDQIVWFIVPSARFAELDVTGPIALAAMNATGTVRLGFHDFTVSQREVVRVQPSGEWAAGDAIATAMPPLPAVGVARRALALLGPLQPVVTASLTAQLEAFMASASKAVKAGTPSVDARTELLAFALRCTQALVSAQAGGAMRLDRPAQRLAREALFYLVQAQTSAIRDSTLRRLVDG